MTVSDPLLPPAPPSSTTDLSDSDGTETDLTEQLLRLHLLPDTTALLPVAQLTEVLKIPIGQITPMPHMPDWVMGIYNWRGEILWMIDLGSLAGLMPWYRRAMSASNYAAIVLDTKSSKSLSKDTGKQTLGLVVNRVEDIEWCNPNSIQSPPASGGANGLIPFSRGYWRTPDGEMRTVLDSEAIFEAMPKP
ncbi:MAG: chemotaxis protein CheW [Leptolyngbyaceae cyanobacterium MO_188.B28]|nr:chemotaxis protein CheW [Leptolyngbyaceae cyanobacterium MO_188.B28]